MEKDKIKMIGDKMNEGKEIYPHLLLVQEKKDKMYSGVVLLQPLFHKLQVCYLVKDWPNLNEFVIRLNPKAWQAQNDRVATAFRKTK